MTVESTDLVNVRYLVDDLDAAIDFYTSHPGFTVRSSGALPFADVTRGHLRSLLSGPTGITSEPARLRAGGVRLRSDPVELFQPATR